MSFVMENNKLYIVKFIKNKQVPNAIFALTLATGEQVEMDLETTVSRIYQAGQGNDVKKILKRGNFRQATIEQCIKLFEGAAQRFLLDDLNSDASRLVQDVLEKAHRRKDSLYLEINNNDTPQFFEVFFTEDDAVENPYTLKERETNATAYQFTKREFIEFLLKEFESILQVI